MNAKTHTITLAMKEAMKKAAEKTKEPVLCKRLSIVDIGVNLPSFETKQIYKSLMLSLNWSIIAFVQKHVAGDQREQVPDNPSIDVFNDTEAAIDALLGNEAHSEEIGFTPMMPPLETAHAYAKIRKWLEIEVRQIEKNEKLMLAYVPVSSISTALGDTLKQMVRPQPLMSETQARAYAESRGMEVAHVMAADKRKKERSQNDTAKHAVAIAECISNFPDYSDETEADDAFDSLSFVQKVVLYSKVLKFFDKQLSYLSERIMNPRSGGDDQATYNIVLARKRELLRDVHEFLYTHPAQYEEFYRFIPSFDEIDTPAITAHKAWAQEQSTKVKAKMERAKADQALKQQKARAKRDAKVKEKAEAQAQAQESITGDANEANLDESLAMALVIPPSAQ